MLLLFVTPSFLGTSLRAPSTGIRSSNVQFKPVSMTASSSGHKSLFDMPTRIDPSLPGYKSFDPLGFTTYINVAWLREAELKHGRICMLAFLGIVIGELVTFPFYASGAAPNLWVEKHNWAVTQGSLQQILLWASFWEIMTTNATIQMVKGKSDREPGNFMFDPLKLGTDNPVMRTKEIKNGRLAMLAVAGLYLQSIVTGQGAIQQLASGNLLPPIF